MRDVVLIVEAVEVLQLVFAVEQVPRCLGESQMGLVVGRVEVRGGDLLPLPIEHLQVGQDRFAHVDGGLGRIVPQPFLMHVVDDGLLESALLESAGF